MSTDRRNTGVGFINPQNYHGCPTGTDHDLKVPEIDLLSPLTSHGVAFPNVHEIRTKEHLHDYSA